MCLHQLGRPTEAAALADSLGRELDQERYLFLHQYADLAAYYAWRGDAAQSVHWLERAVAHSPMLHRWQLASGPVRQGAAHVRVRGRFRARANAGRGAASSAPRGDRRVSDVPRAAEFRCDVPTVERLAELAKAPLPIGLVLRSQRRAFVRDVYVDTVDSALAARNIVCRVRYGADDRRTLTVSLAEPGVPGAGPSEVFDADVAAIDLPAILASDTAPARRLRGIVDLARLESRFELEIDRLVRVASRPWYLPGRFAFLYDRVTVRSGGLVREFQELKVRRLARGRPAARGAGPGPRAGGRRAAGAPDEARPRAVAASADGPGADHPESRFRARRGGDRARRRGGRAVRRRRGPAAARHGRGRRAGGALRAGRMVRVEGRRGESAGPLRPDAGPAEPRGVGGAAPPPGPRPERRSRDDVGPGAGVGPRGARGRPPRPGHARGLRCRGALAALSGARGRARDGGPRRRAGRGRAGRPARLCREPARVQCPGARRRRGRADAAAGAVPLPRHREREPRRALHGRRRRGACGAGRGDPGPPARLHRALHRGARGARAPAPRLGGARAGTSARRSGRGSAANSSRCSLPAPSR